MIDRIVIDPERVASRQACDPWHADSGPLSSRNAARGRRQLRDSSGGILHHRRRRSSLHPRSPLAEIDCYSYHPVKLYERVSEFLVDASLPPRSAGSRYSGRCMDTARSDRSRRWYLDLIRPEYCRSRMACINWRLFLPLTRTFVTCLLFPTRRLLGNCCHRAPGRSYHRNPAVAGRLTLERCQSDGQLARPTDYRRAGPHSSTARHLRIQEQPIARPLTRHGADFCPPT